MNIITCMSLIPVILLNNYHCNTGFHLCAVAQFCIQTMRDKSVETLISVKWPLFPLCVPHPFPPKPMLYFRPLSLSFTLDNNDSGVGGGGGYGVRKECNIKGMKLLIKAHVLNKCFNYFWPLIRFLLDFRVNRGLLFDFIISLHFLIMKICP